MLEDEGPFEDFEPGRRPSAPEGTGSGGYTNPYDVESAVLAATEEIHEGDYCDPDSGQWRIEKNRRQHAAALLGEYGLARKLEAETAKSMGWPVWRGLSQQPVTMTVHVGVSELHRLREEDAADVLHRVSAALDDIPADRQGDVYHGLRDKAIKALQGKKGARRAAEAFVDRHLSEPLGERSPFRPGGLRDVDIAAMKPPAMLVKSLIPQGEVGIITGESGTGKSWLVAALGQAVAFGGSWLGEPVETTGHVRLFLPEGRISYPQRLAGGIIRAGLLPGGATRADLSEALAGRISITDGHTVLDDPRLEAHLREDVEAHGTRLVVFDTLNRSLGIGQDENDANDAKAVMNTLHRLATDTGCTFLLVHHPPHGEKRERGSRVWRDAPDFRFLIYGTDRDVRDGRPVTLWNVKQRNIAPADRVGYRLSPYMVEFDGGDISGCSVQRAAAVTEIPLADRIRWFVEDNPGLPKSRAISGVHGDDKAISKEIDALLTAGKLRNANENASGPWALFVDGEWDSVGGFEADPTEVDLSDLTGSGEPAEEGQDSGA